MSVLGDDVNLEEIERRALRAYHEDGLIDVFIGGYFLLLSLYFSIKIDDARFLRITPLALGTWLYLEAKKRITDPRLGYVRLTKERTRRVAFYTIIIMIVTGFVMLSGLFYHMGIPDEAPPLVLFLNRYNLVFQGVVIAIIFLSLGRLMHLSRFYRYSVISLLVFSSGYIYLSQPFIYSTQNTAISCMFIGFIILVLGVIRLRRFIGKYSVRPN